MSHAPTVVDPHARGGPSAERDPLDLIVRNSSDFIGISDLNGIPFYTNDAAIRMVGAADLDEMRRTPVVDYFVPEDRAFVRDVVLPSVLRDGRWRGELRLRHFRTHAPIHIIYDVFLLRDPATGEPRHFATISRDISEEKRREEALRTLTGRVKQQARLFDTIKDFASIVDPAGRVVFANKSLLETWGRSLEAVRGKTYRELGYPSDVAMRLEQQLAQVVSSASPIAAEMDYTSPSGVAGRYEYVLNPVRDAQGVVEAIAISTHDITARKAVEHALRENAERLRAALDAAAAGTFRWDFDSDALTWDDSLDRLFGLEPGVTARSLQQFVALVHPDDRQGVIERCRASRQHGADFEMEFRVCWPDGSEHWLYDRGKTFIEDGRPSYMTGACVDVTRRKQVEAVARDASERLRLAVDATGVGTWDFYPQTGVLIWDERCRELFGATRNEPMSYPRFLELLHPDDHAMLEPKVRSVLGPNGPGTLSVEYRTRLLFDGAPRWLYATGRTVFVNNVAERFVGTVQDITERKHAEQALRDASRRKSEFLAILAHELRNPLAPIRNGLDVMRLAGNDPIVLSRIRPVMERQLGHMVRLIDDLLDLSRIDHGKIVLERRQLDVTRVVRSSVDASQSLISNRGHEFTLLLPSHPLYIDADETRIAQVIYNLVNNAASYTPPGGRIELSVEQAGTEAVITVKDTGVGIPAEAQAHIFESFTRLDHAANSPGGLGIGLTICAQLVKMHGGTISVHSAGPSQGSEFVVRLPLVEPKHDAPRAASVETRRAARRILIADDNRDAAEALMLMLKAMGHEVVAVYRGVEVLKAVGDFAPDIVLLDIGMPDLDGYEVCRQLRSGVVKRAPKLIVAVTGWGQEEDRRKSRDAGFDHHLVKPVDLAELDGLFSRLDTTSMGATPSTT